jgi:hypothetical protein
VTLISIQTGSGRQHLPYVWARTGATPGDQGYAALGTVFGAEPSTGACDRLPRGATNREAAHQPQKSTQPGPAPRVGVCRPMPGERAAAGRSRARAPAVAQQLGRGQPGPLDMLGLGRRRRGMERVPQNRRVRGRQRPRRSSCACHALSRVGARCGTGAAGPSRTARSRVAAGPPTGGAEQLPSPVRAGSATNAINPRHRTRLTLSGTYWVATPAWPGRRHTRRARQARLDWQLGSLQSRWSPRPVIHPATLGLVPPAIPRFVVVVSPVSDE